MYKINLYRINLRALMYPKFLPVHYYPESIINVTRVLSGEPKFYTPKLKLKAAITVIILFIMVSAIIKF